MWRNRSSLRPTAIELFDELFEQGASPAILVFVDAWTSWGGSQYLDSPALGLYHSYLCNGLSRGSTLATGPRRIATIGPSPGSRAAATGRWSRR